jgi:hypothetical protein
LIDGRRELLGSEEALRLQGAVLAVLALCDVEDNGVSVELWRGVAIYGPGGVMFELGGNEFCRGLRRMVSANARHRVILQTLKSGPDTFPVRLAHSVIAAYQCGERHGFRS